MVSRMNLKKNHSDELDGLVVATAAEVMRAKGRILEALASGPKPRADLISASLAAAGVMPKQNKDERVDVPEMADDTWHFDATHPAIMRVRLTDAAEEALAQLADSGVLAELETTTTAYVTIQQGGRGFGYKVDRSRPRLASQYGLTRRTQMDATALLDVDIFSADLTALNLHDRTLRCLDEALESYRRGLFLSCINLLGLVSEGAWYQVGEALRERVKGLPKALDNDNAAGVIRLSAEGLRSAGAASASEIAEMHSHGAYLRDLRNYGVHPRSGSDDGIEHAFTDHGAGLILMNTHRYLTRLAGALAKVGEARADPQV